MAAGTEVSVETAVVEMEYPSDVAVEFSSTEDTASENSTHKKANSNAKESGERDVVKDSGSDSKSELQMEDIVDMLKKLKLNPLAKEFFPSSYYHSEMGSNNFLGNKNSGIDGSTINRRRRNNHNQVRRRMGVRTFRAQREDSIRRTVYVSDIDHNVTEERLAALFSAYGQPLPDLIQFPKEYAVSNSYFFHLVRQIILVLEIFFILVVVPSLIGYYKSLTVVRSSR